MNPPAATGFTPLWLYLLSYGCWAPAVSECGESISLYIQSYLSSKKESEAGLFIFTADAFAPNDVYIPD